VSDVARTTAESGEYPVSKIEETPWNPNVMPPEKYAAMKEDMRRDGPKAIDRVLLASKRRIFRKAGIPEDLMIAVDGSHRVRAAKELGWKTIRGELDPAIDSVDKAMLITFRKNEERGSMDPYRLAEYFDHFSKKGLRHEDIARLHNIDRTTVTRVLSLLKIEPEVRLQLGHVPRITVSHLEVVGSLRPDLQRELVREKVEGGDWTIRANVPVTEFERTVQELKREDAARQKFAKALEGARFKDCPTCGLPALRFSWVGSSILVDQAGHEWSVKNGKPVADEKGPAESELPKSIRSERTVEEFARALSEKIREAIPQIAAFSDVSITGKARDGKDISLRLDNYSNAVSAQISGTSQDLELVVEGKTYITPDLQRFRTQIFSDKKYGQHTKEELKELQRHVDGLFSGVPAPRPMRAADVARRPGRIGKVSPIRKALASES